jgi:hypothetical protein
MATAGEERAWARNALRGIGRGVASWSAGG